MEKLLIHGDWRLTRNSDNTVPLDDTYAETTEYGGRTYQQYSLTNETYFAPVDEVRMRHLHLERTGKPWLTASRLNLLD